MLGQIDDSQSSEEVLPTVDRSVDFEVSTTVPCKSFGDRMVNESCLQRYVIADVFGHCMLYIHLMLYEVCVNLEDSIRCEGHEVPP